MNKDTSQWEKAQEGRELENRCWEYLKVFRGVTSESRPSVSEDATGSGVCDPDAPQPQQWLVVE
jgi:hypothetical protein